MKPRLVVLVTHPIQYYAPLYRELASHGDIDLHVIYLSDAGATAYHDSEFNQTFAWDIPLLEGYAHIILEPGLALDGIGAAARYSPKLKKTLTSLKPDAILLYGYASRMNWEALNWAGRHACRVLYSSDSRWVVPQNRWKFWLKKIVIGHFFSRVDAFLCTSEMNHEYIVQFDACVERIFRIPFAIEVERFSESASAPGTPRDYHFAWAGKLIPRKRPGDFIRALQHVAQISGLQIRAVVMGDGPILDQVMSMAALLPVNCHVDFMGFVNQSAMPQALQSAQAFVFTSENEPYGLIATEAAAAGLALIVAEGIGCVGDTVLAQPGVNAKLYPPGNVQALAEAMLELRTGQDVLLQMQEASLEIAKGHSMAEAAAILGKTVRQVCAHPVTGQTA